MTKKLPKGWVWAKLGEVCDARRGTSITKKETTPGKYPVIAGGRVPSYYHNQFNRKGETVTVSASGAYAGFVDYHDQPIFASDCSTFQADKNGRALIRFLFLFLKSRQDKIYKMQLGAAQPHVYCRDIVKIDIPLPPIAEQKRIADLLNRQMAVAEKARAAAEAQLEDIRVLPAACLREVLSTPPKTWQRARLGDVCEISGEYGSNCRAMPFNNVRYVRITDIDDRGHLVDAKKRSPDLVENKYFLKPGDLLLARSGSIGRSYVHGHQKGDFQFAGYLIRYRPAPKIVFSRYLFYITKSAHWFDWINKQAKAATIANINAKQFSSFDFPLPPLAEQKRIAARLDRQMAAADKIRAAAEARLEDIRALPAALLRREFL